jgi:hypothetical protein
MRTFQWNALRKGDSVVIHDGLPAMGALVPGVVTSVSMKKGSNDVGIRFTTANGRSKIVWPNSSVVHLSVTDDECWRCTVG